MKMHELREILRSAGWREYESIFNDPHIRQQMELAQQIRNIEVGGAAISCAPGAPRSLAAERKAALDAYKAEVLSEGRQLSNTDIWQAAHYRDKSVFYRWLAGKCDSEPIERVLREKPHLPPPKPLPSHLP
jgi:hypothetical protein